MREELAQMLRHASLARWQPDADVALALFDRHTTLLPPPVVNSAQRLICSDRDDQVFIDLAICARVDWLITHDRALLKLARRALRFGVRVVRPVDWPPPASGR
jgi:predicted nucleic acid-binding protein